MPKPAMPCSVNGVLKTRSRPVTQLRQAQSLKDAMGTDQTPLPGPNQK